VEAQRAAAATKFSLDDSANQRSWFDSLGAQGRNADLSATDAFGKNIEASRFGLDKTKTMGDLAFRSEEMDFDKNKEKGRMAFDIDDHKATRLGAGISTAFGSDDRHRQQLNDAYGAAGDAQGDREDRVNKLHDQLSDFSGDVQNFLGDNFDAILGGDQQMSDQEMEAMIAQRADERGWNDQQTERFSRDLKAAVEAYKATQTPGGAGGAGGAGG
jgi:hypothetical protein